MVASPGEPADAPVGKPEDEEEEDEEEEDESDEEDSESVCSSLSTDIHHGLMNHRLGC